jgi:ketosteroid isomerase-like protein
LTFIPSADYLIVEGISQARMSGKPWAGDKTPGGRFCNVFKFRDGRISNLHIYLDPINTGEDEARFRWVAGRPGEAPAYAGTDFIIARDGRIAALYLFFDRLP